MTSRRVMGVYEAGITELIADDETIAQNRYSKSASVNIAQGSTYPRSGEVLAVSLASTLTGTGSVLEPTGKLIFFDADPAIAANDAAITVAEHRSVIGQVDVAATDWVADAAGARAFVPDQPVPFHNISTIYVAWFHTLATSYNSLAADDELLHVNFWYRLDD